MSAAPPADLAGVDLTAPDFASTDLGHAPLGQPIAAPANQWTWIDFPDAVCDDGTPTGLAIKMTGSKNLIVFLNGGGACWEYTTCAVLNTSAHGPFGKAQFDQLLKNGLPDGSIYGPQADNPVKDWNQVFVPYCTGDNHFGDDVMTYFSPDKSMSKTMHFKGHANILAYLERLAPTFPSVDKFMWAGASAGGFGALGNYDTARHFITGKQNYLLDDSGPPFPGETIQTALIDWWFAAWNLNETTGELCPGCRDDLSQLLWEVDNRYPGERKALLSSLQDQVISGFYLLPPGPFQTDLLELSSTRLDSSKNFHYFFEKGNQHTMVLNLDGHMTGGVTLNTWLTQMLSDDPAWKSIKP